MADTNKTLCYKIYVSLVEYVDCITILGRCVGFVVETYLELDAIRDVRLRYNIMKRRFWPRLEETGQSLQKCHRKSIELKM
jgi:hypothetical protein